MHGDERPPSLGTVAAVLMPAGFFVGGWLAAGGAVLLVSATVWNVPD